MSPTTAAPYGSATSRLEPAIAELPMVVRRSNGLAESVGESRSRIRLEDMGLRPEPPWRAREVLLEELTGPRMFRLVWPDLDDADLEARIRRAARTRRAA